MQANQKEVYNQIHQTIQSTVEKMYKRIDAIIQSAKAYVEENPESGEKTVQHITAYTRYMHRTIDAIVEEYTNFLKNGEETSINSFKEKLSQYISYAKNATLKVQALISQ
jgi:hypothetical protein